jgi:transposase-like protein
MERKLDKIKDVEELNRFAAQHNLENDDAIHLKRLELMANALSAQTSGWDCIHCLKSFKYRKHLLRHQRTVHGNQSHQCPICQANFSRLDSLNRHMKSHKDKQSTSNDYNENKPPTAKQPLLDQPIKGQCTW